MILADQFKCVIPSENAIREGSALHCTGFPPIPPAASEVWAAWIDALASWAGILLTIVLARYAWKAWKEAQRANGLIKQQLAQAELALEKELSQAESGLRTQIESTDSGLQTQIDSALELSMRERELEQLRLYCESLMRLANDSAIPPDADNADVNNFEQERGEASIRWASWTMYLMSKDPDLRDATSIFHNHYLEETKRIHTMACGFQDFANQPAMQAERIALIGPIAEKQQKVFDAVGRFVAKIQHIAVQGKDYELHRDQLIYTSSELRETLS